MTTILLVEDDVDIVEAVELFLNHEGYQVVHMDDGSEVLRTVLSHMPDLVIMDVMLPNLDGFECTKAIRKVCNVPVIMLTARVEQTDKRLGLEMGADDYLTKPFDARELVLRIKALLRRTEGHVHYGHWSIDEGKYSVSYDGITLFLSAVEFKLFSLLYNAPERVFTRQQIMDSAYSDDRNITDRTIDSHIKNLRKKLKQQEIDPAHIESVYGAGYRFLRDI